jgi:DNA-directed RNA polymerase specialized sigma24 family protein
MPVATYGLSAMPCGGPLQSAEPPAASTMHPRPRGTTRCPAPAVPYASSRASTREQTRPQPEGTVTADQTPEHDPDRAVRDAERERERAASRARQRAAYQRAQRASRSRALRAAAEHVEPARPAADAQQGSTTPSTTPPFLGAAWLVRALLEPEDPRDLPPTELTAIELVEQRLEEAELQRALLEALAALPTDQRVAVVAALGYAEGPAGAAMELDLDPHAAEQLAQQGLDALRHALSPFLTHND